MPNDRRARFREQITRAIQEGKLGRQQLVDYVTRVPAERIAALPPSAITLLGPVGLAAIARNRTDMVGLSAAPTPAGKARLPAPPPSRHKHPLTAAGIAATVVLLVGGTADLILPPLRMWLDPGVRSVSTATWPACPRLDAHVDGCLYTTGHDGLTLLHAATLLTIPPARLAATNPHLTTAPTTPLPAGSVLVIWREKFKPKGNKP